MRSWVANQRGSFAYYVRRLVAQGIDGIVVSLIGVVIFLHSSHSPVLRDEHQWQLILSPCFPSQYGLWVASKGPGVGWGNGSPDLAPPQGSIRLWQTRMANGGEQTISYLFDARWGLMLLYGLYYALGTGYRGQTVGKYLMRLRVVGKEGQRIGYGRALLRWVLYRVSLLPFWLGMIWIFVDRQHRAWHDGLCGTRVVEGEVVPAEA